MYGLKLLILLLNLISVQHFSWKHKQGSLRKVGKGTCNCSFNVTGNVARMVFSFQNAKERSLIRKQLTFCMLIGTELKLAVSFQYLLELLCA